MKPPKLICPPLNKHGFAIQAKFNPRKPADIYNPLPQSKWPFKFNEPVYFLHQRHGTPCAGRVSWYHPARQIDASCIISPGHPFFRVVVNHGETPRDCLPVLSSST